MATPFRTAKLEETAPERFVRLRKPLGITSFGINQMVLEPGQRMRKCRREIRTADTKTDEP